MENLLNPSSTILNEDEKNVLIKTFVDPFETLTDYMMEALKEYLVLYEQLIANLK